LSLIGSSFSFRFAEYELTSIPPFCKTHLTETSSLLSATTRLCSGLAPPLDRFPVPFSQLFPGLCWTHLFLSFPRDHTFRRRGELDQLFLHVFRVSSYKSLPLKFFPPPPLPPRVITLAIPMCGSHGQSCLLLSSFVEADFPLAH